MVLNKLTLHYAPAILLNQLDWASDIQGKEPNIYFYHGDHLGSANWITESVGKPIQYIHYAPYGELIADTRFTDYRERFTFTGKERDKESGYDYEPICYDDNCLTQIWHLSFDDYGLSSSP